MSGGETKLTPMILGSAEGGTFSLRPQPDGRISFASTALQAAQTHNNVLDRAAAVMVRDYLNRWLEHQP